MEVKFKHPFSMLVSGGRGAGKTEFTKDLLLFRNECIDKPIDRLVWLYAKHQPNLYSELLQIDSNIEYINGITSDLESIFDMNVTNLLVIDDLMEEASKDKEIQNLFTRGRHLNLSVIFLTQNLFHKQQRVISLNSDYMVIFKNPRDKSQFSNLARQVMPRNRTFLENAFEDAVKNPFGYLFLDLKPSTDDKFRIRTRVLPHNDSNTHFQYQILYTR